MEVVTIVTNLLKENAYFLYDKETKDAVLIDPGGSAQMLKEFIDVNQLSLKAILLTHAHFDHIDAVGEVKEHTSAPIALYKDEAELLLNSELNLSKRIGKVALEFKADILFDDGEIFKFGEHVLEVIHTPGHTRGGCCYYSKKEALLFSGDTLFRCTVGRTDFEGGDGNVLIASIKERLLVLPEETKVYPGHGDSTDVAFEKRHNYFCKTV